MTRGGQRPGAGRPINKDPKKHTVRLTDSEKDFIDFSRIKLIDLRKLKKSLLVILALFIFVMPVNAEVFKLSAEYTVDEARIIAFDNSEMTIPVSEFNLDIFDNYYYTNITAIKAGKTIAGYGYKRKLVPFYDKHKKLSFYGVQSEYSPNKKFYYSPAGRLLKYEYNTFKGTYPYKTVAYDRKGRLTNINLIVSDNEVFIFNKNKKLIAHWVGDTCYNENGEIDLTRSR